MRFQKRWLGLLLLSGMVLLASCGKDENKPTNHDPTLPEISPADFMIMPGDSVLLTGTADDPDDDELTYRWTMDAGTPLTATGPFVVWRAPQQNVTAHIQLTASDGRGGTRSATTTTMVHPNAAFPYTSPFETQLEPDLSHLDAGSAKPASQPPCHFWASVVVTWTNAAVVVFTGLPTLAFAAALTLTPVWDFPDTWIWAYTVPWGGALATVQVRGTLVEPTRIDWSMLVSGTVMNYDDFVWVTGQSNTEAREGYWILNDHRVTQTQTPALRLDWSRDSATDFDLDYHNILESSANFGDSLGYSFHAPDAEVLLYSASDDRTTRVRWNTETGAGSLVPASGDSCCWGPAPNYPYVECD